MSGSGNYQAPEPNQMFTLGHEKWKRTGPTPLQSTAGAIEIRDSRGRIVGMEKVKVTRYMTGKRPDWAPEEFDSDEELSISTKQIKIKVPGALPDGEGTSEDKKEEQNVEIKQEEAASDRRLARLLRHENEKQNDPDADDEGGYSRSRYRAEPELLPSDEERSSDEEDEDGKHHIIFFINTMGPNEWGTVLTQITYQARICGKIAHFFFAKFRRNVVKNWRNLA